MIFLQLLSNFCLFTCSWQLFFATEISPTLGRYMCPSSILLICIKYYLLFPRFRIFTSLSKIEQGNNNTSMLIITKKTKQQPGMHKRKQDKLDISQKSLRWTVEILMILKRHHLCFIYAKPSAIESIFYDVVQIQVC